MCHTVFILHVYYLAFISGGGGDGGGVADNKTAKPVTAVQDCVFTFASVKPLDIFDRMSGHFQPCLRPRNWVLFRCFGTFPAMFVVSKDILC